MYPKYVKTFAYKHAYIELAPIIDLFQTELAPRMDLIWITTGVSCCDAAVDCDDCSGVDVWPLLTGANATQPRPLTPVTEVSIVDTSDRTRWWKLITLAGQSGKKTALFVHFICENASFYQDRLGTNIGKALKKVPFSRRLLHNQLDAGEKTALFVHF